MRSRGAPPLVVLFFALALHPYPAAGFSGGSGTCTATAAAASPMGVPQSGDGGYALVIEAESGIPANQYLPGASAMLRLTGDTAFKGLLVYAEDAQGNRIGGFTAFGVSIYRLLAGCAGDADGTLTHASNLFKVPPQAFRWRAPAANVGPLTFRAIVLRGFNDYYVITSAPIVAAEMALFVDGFEPSP